MIRINLLPIKKSRRAEAMRAELILAGVGLGAVVLLLLLGQVWLLARVHEREGEKTTLNTRIEEMKAVVAQVEEIEKLKTDLQQKLHVIKQLKANKAGPVRLLDELAIATPEKLQITSLDEKGGLIKLSGYAVSNEVISQFLSNLESSQFLREVYLNAIDQKAIQGIKLKTFAVTMRLVVPGVAEAEASA